MAAVALASCTEPSGEPGKGIEHGGALNKSDVGTAAGAVAGGLVGSAFGGGVGNALAIVGGGLLGGILGHEVGASLDRADQAAYEHASQNAMDSGQARTWKNPQTGHHGTIIPSRSYQNAEGQHCRKYTQIIYVEGKRHKAHGTACREEDGTWRIVE